MWPHASPPSPWTPGCPWATLVPSVPVDSWAPLPTPVSSIPMDPWAPPAHAHPLCPGGPPDYSSPRARGIQTCCKAEPAGALSWVARGLSAHRPRAVTKKMGPRCYLKSEKTNPKFSAFRTTKCEPAHSPSPPRSALHLQAWDTHSSRPSLLSQQHPWDPHFHQGRDSPRDPVWTPDSGATPTSRPSGEAPGRGWSCPPALGKRWLWAEGRGAPEAQQPPLGQERMGDLADATPLPS